MRRRMLLPLIGLLVAGCGADPLQRGHDPLGDRVVSVRAAIGDTIRLRVGQLAEVGAEPLRILFDGVEADSRCPRGVDCVWSGDAAARLRLTLPGAPAAEATLHTHDGPAELVHGGYVVRLLDVEPYPVYQEPIAPGDYAVLLRVTRP